MLLALMLAACGGAPTDPATPVPSPATTATQERPTATATPDATATAGAQAATATAEASATAAALAATAEAEQLFARARPVFRDEFVDNRNAWYTGIFQSIETNTIEDGVFKVSWGGRGTSYELYMVRDLGDFIAEVDCQIVQGGAEASCGLIFGQNEDIGYYKYELFEDYYRLFLVPAVGEPLTLAEGNPAGLLAPGEPNRLRVVREGERIRVFLNGAPLGEALDATYLSGKVGVTTSSYRDEGGGEIWFDDFVIWELEQAGEPGSPEASVEGFSGAMPPNPRRRTRRKA
jgi:hypothetical protein